MGKIRTLGLLASAATLWLGASHAFAQQVVGGMGEPIHIGTFGAAQAESRLAARHPAQKSSAKAPHARGAEIPETRARYAKPTLPGRHLR
jgi:hypothetical protein